MRVLRNAVAAGVLMALMSGAAVQAQTRSEAHAQAPKKSLKIDEKNGKYEFAKATLTVKVGTKVVFNNASDAQHTVTSKKSGLFDTGLIAAGKSKSLTFKKVGTFKYSCSIHPYMVAKIVVTK